MTLRNTVRICIVRFSDLQCTIKCLGTHSPVKKTTLPSDTLVVYGSIQRLVVSLLISSLQVLRS